MPSTQLDNSFPDFCRYSTARGGGGTVEWSDFWREKNWTCVMLCQIVLGPQSKNFTFYFCFLTWSRASDNFSFDHVKYNFDYFGGRAKNV